MLPTLRSVDVLVFTGISEQNKMDYWISNSFEALVVPILLDRTNSYVRLGLENKWSN